MSTATAASPAAPTTHPDEPAASPAPVSAPVLKVISDATCTFCGCVCDDMELTVENDGIVVEGIIDGFRYVVKGKRD